MVDCGVLAADIELSVNDRLDNLYKRGNMNKQERMAILKSVNDAVDFESEQAAIAKGRVVDIRPSLPAGAADLYHQWDEKEDSEANIDYAAVVRRLGAGFDRGARRYVINAADALKYRDALQAEGFVVAVHPSLTI